MFMTATMTVSTMTIGTAAVIMTVIIATARSKGTRDTFIMMTAGMAAITESNSRIDSDICGGGYISNGCNNDRRVDDNGRNNVSHICSSSRDNHSNNDSGSSCSSNGNSIATIAATIATTQMITAPTTTPTPSIGVAMIVAYQQYQQWYRY
jgi:hypothetical protein